MVVYIPRIMKGGFQNNVYFISIAAMVKTRPSTISKKRKKRRSVRRLPAALVEQLNAWCDRLDREALLSDDVMDALRREWDSSLSWAVRLGKFDLLGTMEV